MAKKIGEYGEKTNGKCGPCGTYTHVAAVAADFCNSALGKRNKIYADDTNVCARRC
jgi:hypothetical protein